MAIRAIDSNLICYKTTGFDGECMEYYYLYYEKIKIFCTKKQKKTHDFEKKSVYKILQK